MLIGKKIENFLTALDNYIDEKISVNNDANNSKDSYDSTVGSFSYHFQKDLEDALYDLFDTEQDKI